MTEVRAGQALVAIVIPTYNSRYIEETIDSVLAQTLADWHLLVIDDGSTDDTPAIIARYAAQDSRIQLLEQKNAGVAAARNRGAAELDPAIPYLMFLDHDDLLEPTALADLAAVLDAHPEMSAVQGDFLTIDSDSQPIPDVLGLRRRRLEGWHFVDCEPEEPTSLAVIIASDCILTPGQVLIRRAHIAADQELFPSRYDTYDDWMAWINISHLGAIAYLPQVVLRYRRHAHNQSHDVKKLFHGRRAIFRDIIHTGMLERPDRRRACVASMWLELGDAWHKLRGSALLLLKMHPRTALKEGLRASVCLLYAADSFAWYTALMFV